MMKRPTKFQDYMKNIFLKYSILTILLIFSLYILSLYFAFNTVVVKKNKQVNGQISSLVEQEFGKYEQALKELADHQAIQQVFSEPSLLWQVNDLLYSSRSNMVFKANFALLNKQGAVISTNLYEDNVQALTANYVVKDLLTQPQHATIQRTFDAHLFQKEQSSAYFFAEPIWSNEELQGYLFYFLEDLGKHFHHTSDVMAITDRFNQIIYTSDQKLITHLGKLNTAYFSGSTANIDGNSYYVTSNAVTSKQIQILNMTFIDVFEHSVWIGVYSVLGIGFIVMMLHFLALPKIIRQSLRSFEKLIWFIRTPNPVAIKQPIAEFQMIQDEFSNKLTQIQSLMEANAAIAETKRKMEIKQLEHQFNPHFVFNVLEMLRYEILFNPENAADIVVSFASLLRYNIHHQSTTVPLETDMHYVQSYLKLQKMRFNKRLDYTLTMDEHIKNAEVPVFIIQPLIENSIKHGIEQTHHLQIDIVIQQKGEHVYMHVKDDGQGIEPEKLLELKQMLLSKSNKSEHYGLYHSHRMIQLLYGEQYGLTIESTYGEGTHVQVVIPLKEG